MKVDKTTIDAALEMLRFEIDKVAANITDINTVSKKARTVTLKLKFSPNERDREDVEVSISVNSDLAPVHPFTHDVRIVKKSGQFTMQSNRQVMDLLNNVDQPANEMEN